SNTDFGSAHNIAINEDTGFDYIVGSYYSDDCWGGLLMFDISTPTEPSVVGCFAGGTPVGEPDSSYPTDVYTHDVQCVSYSGPDPDYKDRELCFTADEQSLGIVDVSDKAAPVQVARVSYSGVGYTHQGWLTEDQRYFLLDDEFDEILSSGETKTYIWDMLDLDAPELIGTIENPSEAIGHNLYTRGDLAYQANYTSGLRIVDLSQVASGSGSEIAYYDTYPEDDFFFAAAGVQSRSRLPRAQFAAQSPLLHPEGEGQGAATFNGAWGNYPYFESGIIVVSDIERGLFVLRKL
ncbi:MAG TPA: choice-of-anchor B family protein, partial [Nannocystis exedens]|nr:choice-of-anchor B family protein [Nannocystis exedens]